MMHRAIRTDNVKFGFTLIETMLAIALIAMVMTPLMVTQGTIVQAIARISLRLQRIFFAENFFIEARADADDQSKFSMDKKIDLPNTKLVFERKPIDAKSSLAKIDNLVIDRIQASWQDENKQEKEVLVSLQYIQPQSKT
jgi:prepilin-type N-terminal cleavage/methylation domain-containing protein